MTAHFSVLSTCTKKWQYKFELIFLPDVFINVALGKIIQETKYKLEILAIIKLYFLIQIKTIA